MTTSRMRAMALVAAGALLWTGCGSEDTSPTASQESADIEIKGAWSAVYTGGDEPAILLTCSITNILTTWHLGGGPIVGEVIRYDNPANYCIVRWTEHPAFTGLYVKLEWLEEPTDTVTIQQYDEWDTQEAAVASTNRKYDPFILHLETPLIRSLWPGSAHTRNDVEGHEVYGRFLLVGVDDPKGLGNILSVRAVDSRGSSYELTDLNGDGTYDHWENYSTRFDLDSYAITITNKDGNTAQSVATVTRHIEEFPVLLSHTHGGLITERVPLLRWTPVDVAGGYWVWVDDMEILARVWAYWATAPTTEVRYNADGQAQQAELVSGRPYHLSVMAMDADGNWSWHLIRATVQ